MVPEAPIYVCLYGGTGIGKLLHPLGKRYYRSLLRGVGIADVLDCGELISLPGAGLLHYLVRDENADRVLDHKFPRGAKFITMGHSQGALRSELHALRHPEDVLASVGISGPFEHAPLATWSSWVPWLPSGVRQMAKGSDQLTEIQLRARQLAFLRRYGDPGAMPELHRIATTDDWVVPRDSAWFLTDEYPSELAFRYLLAHKSLSVPEDVDLILASRWYTNHLGEVLAPQLVKLIAGIVRRHHETFALADPNGRSCVASSLHGTGRRSFYAYIS